MSHETRFWNKIAWGDKESCWLWTAGKTKAGYGHFYIKGRGMVYAHRLAWELKHSNPGRSHVLHSCDTPACVNPDHLFLGDHAANMQDCARKGRVVAFGRGRKPHWKETGRKITREIAEEIRRAPGSHRTIAERYGLHQTTVSDIKRGDIWK
jgi:hypothetical protein